MKGQIIVKTNAGLGTFAILTSFLITYILGFLIIPILKKLKARQTIKEIGPTWHKSKNGIPTMGGIFLIFGIVCSCLLFLIFVPLLKNKWFFLNHVFKEHEIKLVLINLFCAVSLGFIGFMDDFFKVINKQNKGLSAIQKTVFQLTIIVSYFVSLKLNLLISTTVNVPFFGQVDFGFFYYIISVFGMYGIVNAVNLTDGLDGLLSSVTAIYAITFIAITSKLSSFGMNLVSCSLLGGCLGFLVWNFFPAKIFMGDTGSMFLGGLVACLGFGINEPVLILIVGIIYVVEALSVVIQVSYFKITGGKRIFKMSPIHHHFEMIGFSEVKILVLFSIVTAIFGVLGFNFAKTF